MAVAMAVAITFFNDSGSGSSITNHLQGQLSRLAIIKLIEEKNIEPQFDL